MSLAINFEAFASIERNLSLGGPFYMLNLLRFRAIAAYEGGFEPAGQTGREAYFGGYLPAFSAVTAALRIVGIAPIFAGSVAGHVAGPIGERWDAIAIVTYPSFDAFRQVVTSKPYARLAEPHRKAALEDWRLVASKKLDLPN